MDFLSQAEVWGGEYWTDGYYVATVEEKNWSAAGRTIRANRKKYCVSL